MPFYILLLRPDVQQFELIKFARHPEKIPSGKILLEQTLKSASHPEFLAQQHDGFYCLETKKEILFADEEEKETHKKKKKIKTLTSKTTAGCVSTEDKDEENTEQPKKQTIHLDDNNSTTEKTEEDQELTPNPPEQQPEPEEDAEDRLLASLLEDDEEEKEEDSAAAAAAEDGVVAAETTNVDDPDVTREPEEFSEAANEEDHEDEESEENDGTEEEENHPFANIGPILVAIPTGFPIQQVDQMSRVIMASSSFQILTTGDDILNKIENTSTTQQELEELHRLAKTTIGTEQFIAQHITANARSNEAYEQQVQDLEDRRTKGAKTRRSSSSSFASTTGSPSSHGVGGWDGSLDLCSSFPSPNAARTSIIVAPRPSVSRPDTHGLSPVDAMRVAQNQQRSQARQNEQATKQQYQLFNSSASSFGSSSSPRPSPMAVTPPSSAKSVVTIDTDTPSIQSSSSLVRKQSIDAKKEQELTLIRQARRDGTPSGSSTKSCTSFGSASFSESSEHKLEQRKSSSRSELDALRGRGLTQSVKNQYLDTSLVNQRQNAAHQAQVRDLATRKSQTSEFHVTLNSPLLSPTDTTHLTYTKWKQDDRKKERETLGYYQQYKETTTTTTGTANNTKGTEEWQSTGKVISAQHGTMITTEWTAPTASTDDTVRKSITVVTNKNSGGRGGLASTSKSHQNNTPQHNDTGQGCGCIIM